MDQDQANDFSQPAYVPGGPFPRPAPSPPAEAIDELRFEQSPAYLHGIALFNNGYYWEAHESWEGLWHAHGRCGPIADLLKGLIKLAAAGVKVRQGQPRGVVTHATRAMETINRARNERGQRLLGLDLDELINRADQIANEPPSAKQSLTAASERVFTFELAPKR